MPLTSQLSARSFLATPGPGVTTIERQRNQIIYAQGDPANSVFYVQDGNIKLTVITDEGKEAVVAILAAQKFFGEACLAGAPVRHATATAFTNCRITRIAKDEMARALREQTEFSEFFLSGILSRSIQLEADLVDQLCNSCEKRLARILLLLPDFGRNGNASDAVPKVDQETLAAMVGTTRPRISFLLNKFKKLGLIDYGESLHIHTSLAKVVTSDTGRCSSLRIREL